ncbi:MAG: acyl-CoA dehydrogenase [Limnobacter sp.]|mgnify:CR=1 FL=1|nr:acyl-CoA dehydrogenase [Limnobacter sp.]
MTTRAMLAAAIGRIGSDLSPPAVVRRAEAGVPADDLWTAIVDSGLDRALVPESAGGAGLAWRDVLPLVQACGEHAMPVPLAETLGAQALAGAAGMAIPEGAASFALLRPQGAANTATDAAQVAWGDRVRTVVGLSASGDVRMLDPEKAIVRHRRDAAGEIRSSMQWPGGESVDRGSAARIDGLAILHVGAALRAAQLAGAMQTVLRLSVRYAGDRVQFGRPIGRFQAIQQQLALMAELVAQATMGAELAFDCDGWLPDPMRAACAKQVASANALRCAAVAHAVHGAIGITAEHDLQLFTRRLRTWAADWGGAHHWAIELGRGVLRGGHSSLWHAVIEGSSAMAREAN